MANNDGKTGFLCQGSTVEVRIDGAWYKADVLTQCANSKDRFRVVCKNLTIHSEEALMDVHISSIRPRPPPPAADQSYKLRDVVDVLVHLYGWWKGVVTGVYRLKGKTSYTVVLFENPPYFQEKVFTSEEMRFHWVWTDDGKWVRPTQPEDIPGHGVELSTVEQSKGKNSSPDQQEAGLKTRLTKSSKKRPREPNAHITNQQVLAAGEKERNSENFNPFSAGNLRPKSEVVKEKVMPLKKSSSHWKYVDSLEVLRLLPQNPHFSHLPDCNEVVRESIALGYTMAFANLVEKVSELEIESLTECYLKALSEFESVGFDVKPIVDCINELLAFKTRKEELENRSKEIDRKIAECHDEKAKLEEEVLAVKEKFRVKKTSFQVKM